MIDIMRIGIDATAIWGIEKGLLTGMMIYTVNIIDRLLKIDQENYYYIYCRDRIPHQLRAIDSPRVNFRQLRSRKRKILQQVKLPFSVNADGLDLMFFPYHSASIFNPCKFVVTIHDLHPFVIPKQFHQIHTIAHRGNYLLSKINKLYWEQILKISARKADKVIAVSNATKKDLVDIFKIPEKKIAVVHEAVNHNIYNQDNHEEDLNTFRQKYQLFDKYILCVGTHSYKNLEGIVRSFHIVANKFPDHLKLIVAGNTDYIGKEIFELVDDLSLSNKVIFTGFFPIEDLKCLYQCAELFLFPSFYEGFGLPVLEAFACGTPVVTSKKGSLPEVAGEAALLVDPCDPEDIASSVLKLLADKSLREEKRQLGLKQIEKFSWDDAARKTLEVFSQVVHG
jgi:glycosyltransferase involved in cell wall biosynthesis